MDMRATARAGPPYPEPVEALIRAVEVRLTAFAVCQIDERWRLSTGPLDSVLVHFVIGGEGFLEAAGARTRLRRGSIILVPPGTPKSITGVGVISKEVSAEESCVLHGAGMLAFRACHSNINLLIGCASLHVHVWGLDELFGRLGGPLVLDIQNAELFSGSFKALLRELSEPSLGTMVFAECLMKQIVVLLLRQHVQEHGPGSPLLALLGDPRLLRAVNDVIAHPEKPHTVSDLAAAAGMSRSGFAMRFAERYGATPMQFVQSARMHSAARLLDTSEIPIKCLAAAVGYSSQTQFTRVFKDAYGVSPKQFRQQAFSHAQLN